MFLHLDLVATRLHIDLAGLQANRLLFALVFPGNRLGIQVHTNFLLQVNDIGILFINRIPLWLQHHHLAIAGHHFIEGITRLVGAAVYTVLLTVITPREGQRATGMLFFSKPE